MPSNALTVHLKELLQDADDLNAAHSQLRTGKPGRQYGLAALNRAAVVISVSAWESYVEELMRECLRALRPASPPLDPWPALNAYVLGLLGQFNTPNASNVTNLIKRSFGLPDIHLAWSWHRCSTGHAATLLNEALDSRHQIAHGVNPRPTIHNPYSSWLPIFFHRLADCTDRAVRYHLVTSLGVLNPWPL